MALVKKIRVRNADKNVEKRVPFPVGRNATWCNHYVKLYEDSLETKIWATVWSSIYPFLGIYGKKMQKLIWNDTCILMFTVALFAKAINQE